MQHIQHLEMGLPLTFDYLTADFSRDTAKDLDEASSAYKNIDIVMENQKDLVEIENQLTPLAVVKG